MKQDHYITDSRGTRIAHNYDTSRLFTEYVVDKTNRWLNAVIPREPSIFYDEFGYLPHPWKRDNRGLPTPVLQLTDYQLAFWRQEGNVICLKSNKIGLSTTSHLELFQSRLLPEEAGFDCLLVAQNQKIANMHLLDLKKIIAQSGKYSDFMIRRPDIELFKEEKTKLEALYVRNPYMPSRPSRIIALGSSAPSGFSWKHINRIHMSDISLIKKMEETEFFAALYSRLANTNGVMKIESIPSAKYGEFYRLWKAANQQEYTQLEEEVLVQDPKDFLTSFTPMELDWKVAVEHGVITQAYIDQAKKDLGEIEFGRKFECKFTEDSSQWYKEEWEHTEEYQVDDIGL